MNVLNMKKNNKFRGNGNSNAYSLNYKFDSVSPAGKVNGTALDLIKRYNELAKEAHSSGNYIEMELFRQYAEHYRKIVTEINERKNFRPEGTPVQNSTPNEERKEQKPLEPGKNEISAATDENATSKNPSPAENKKSFKIVEIQPNADDITPHKLINPKNNNTRKVSRRVKPETTGLFSDGTAEEFGDAPNVDVKNSKGLRENLNSGESTHEDSAAV